MITYDYYRIFYYVAQCHSFTKAAEMLHNNQPNITRCMNNLEHELDSKLLIRTNRGISLTPEGEKLFSHVAAAYEHLLAGEQELQKDRSLESGHITIGASETALRLLLFTKLESFHNQYPGVRLKISNHSTPQAISALEHGFADIAVVTTPIRTNGMLKQIPLYTFSEILVGGTKYSELGSTTHHLRDLAELPYVSLGNGTGTRELYIQYFLNHGLNFIPDMEAATADQILPMIIHNLGIGFYPEELAAPSIKEGRLFPIPIYEPMPNRQICVVLNLERSQSIAVTKFVEELQRT